MSGMRALTLVFAAIVYLFAGIEAFKLSEAFGHQFITRQAISRVHLPLGKAFCQAAIDDFVDYNKHTDYFEPMAEEAHCDGEKLSECSQRILNFKNEGIRLFNQAGALADDGNVDKLVDQARKKFGKALHTLQDFYAHSNYVNMMVSGGGGVATHPSLGKSVLSNPRATDVICLDNFFTLVGTVLSSGYFPITLRWKDRLFCEPIPVGKCRHGFSRENCHGINKDDNSSAFFNTAQTLAILATTTFLEDIYTSLASDDARDAFLGSCGAKLAYIVDTTGSMGSSINGVLAFLSQHATNRAAEMSISTIILTLFNDPDPPVTYKFIDLSSFLVQLTSVTVDGGDDCPELMFGGIYAASQAAPRKAQLFVFSDADAKDSDVASLAAASIRRKLQRVNYVLTGNCGFGSLRRRTSNDLSASSGQFQHAWPTMEKTAAKNADGVARRFSPGGSYSSAPDSRTVMEIWNSVASDSDYQTFTIPPDSIPAVLGARFGSLQRNVAYLFNIEQPISAMPTSPSCTSSSNFCNCATASFVVSEIQQDLLFVAVPNNLFTRNQIINSLLGPSTFDDSILTSLSHYGAASIRASHLPPGNYTYFACGQTDESVTLTLTGTAVTPFTLTSFTFLTQMGRLDEDELAPLLSTPAVGTMYPAFQITMSKSWRSTASDGAVLQPLQNLIAEFVTVAGATITSFPISNISTSGDGYYLLLYSYAMPTVPMEPFYVVLSGLFNNSAFRLSLADSVKPTPIAVAFVPLLSDPTSGLDSLFSAFTILPTNKASILTFNLTNLGDGNFTALISVQPDVGTTAMNDLIFSSNDPFLLPKFSSSLVSVNITPSSNVTHDAEFTLIVDLREAESGALLNSLILEATFVGCSSCLQDVGTCVSSPSGGPDDSAESAYVCQCYPGSTNTSLCSTMPTVPRVPPVTCPVDTEGKIIVGSCRCNAGYRGTVPRLDPYNSNTCTPVNCPANSVGANLPSGCTCSAGSNGTITATTTYPKYFNGTCTPVLCPADSEGLTVLGGCRCSAGYSGSIRATTVDPYFNSTCTQVSCPANSAGYNLPSGCTCNAGFRGSIVASTTAPFFTGSCSAVLCPAYSRGTNVVSGCECNAGCGGFILASSNWPDYYVGSCTPSSCPASSQGINVVSGCRCSAGYSGSVFPTAFYPYYNSTCTPVNCPANSVGINLPSGCQCNIGYSGTIVASTTTPYYSGLCTLINCPTNSQGHSLVSGCQCNAGFSGFIVASLTYPFYSGGCNSLPCPANSRGANVGSGCQCNAGYSGFIVATTTSPYFSGTCSPSDCPANSQLDCSMSGCRCNAGYSGTIVPATIYPYYSGTCAPAHCPANSVGINVPSGCQCTAGHSGFIVARSTAPFFSGSCQPVACPVWSQGPNVVSGCQCIAGSRGFIAASTTWPDYLTGSCTPVPCPVNSRGTSLVTGCQCNAGHIGSVLPTKVDPYFISTCAPVNCPINSVGINVPSGCSCKAGSTGAIYASTSFPFYFGSCNPAPCPANSRGADVISGCQCNAGYSGSIVASVTLLYTGRCIPVLCPANSRGASVVSGCQCNAGYSGSIASSTISPYFSGICSAVNCPANSQGQNVVSRCQCNAGFRGSIAASTVSPYYTGICLATACPANSQGPNVAIGCQCNSGYSGSIVPSTFSPYYSGTCVRSPPPPPPPPPRRPCVAGDALITTHRGTIAARDVVVGDILRGMDGKEACSVVASTHIAPSGTVYGSFTAEHFVVVKNADGTNLIKPQRDALQAAVPGRSMDLVNIATNCPAVQTADGQLFTPLSTVFCPSLTWSQYIPLYAGLLRMVAKTGGFWFDPITAYQDSSASSALYRRRDIKGNANAGPVSWQILLPSICDLMVACATDGSRCDDMEVLAASWIVTHVKGGHLAAVLAAYPNLGNTAAMSGTLSADIRGH